MKHQGYGAVLLAVILLVSLMGMTTSRPHDRFASQNMGPDSFAQEDLDEDDVTKCAVVYTNKGELEIKPENVEPYVARAWFKNSVNSTGWSLLKVVTNGTYSDSLQAEAAGMAEGFLTAEFILMAYENTVAGYCDKEPDFCTKLKTFLAANQDWIIGNLKTHPESQYWHQVDLIYQQLKGLNMGYHVSKPPKELTDFDFMLLQIGGDLEDLEQALGKKTHKKVVGSGSCSALVKLFPGNKDLAISQVTWNDYNSMLRVYKNYNFTFHLRDGGHSLVPGSVQSFSSYPGVLYSGDDFYIINSGLVTQETTIGNGNAALWKYVVPTTLMEWVRTIISNRLAESGNDWVSLFEKFNSGTYNNQWMILDYKLFEAGKPLKPDTLWILEQLPGTVHMADMSLLLEKQGYWSSYNLPYFPYVYNTSGVTADKKKFGSWFDYYQNPRAQIFKRDHSKIVDMETFVKLMRYNDFTNDPLSKCNCTGGYSAENAISARSDLNPVNGTYPFGALGHRRHGATDCKATNSRLAKTLSQFIVAGPTYDQVEPFQWSKYPEWTKPKGHPDLFKFAPSILDWKSQTWIDLHDGQ